MSEFTIISEAELPPAYDWQLIDLTVNVPIEELNRILFVEPDFFLAFNASAKFQEVIVKPWEGSKREFSWISPGSLLVKAFKVFGKQERVLQKPNAYVYLNTTRAPDAIYGDKIENQMQLRLIALSPSRTRIHITARVHLLESFFMSGVVQKTVKGAMVDHYDKHYKAALRTFISLE